MLNAAEDNEWLLLQNSDRNAELERQVMQAAHFPKQKKLVIFLFLVISTKLSVYVLIRCQTTCEKLCHLVFLKTYLTEEKCCKSEEEVKQNGTKIEYGIASHNLV